MTRSSALPSYDRLRKVVAALDAPIVQLWGWPGSGKRTFLEHLLHEDGVGFVAAREMEGDSALDERLDALRQLGVSWLIADLPAASDLSAVSRRLRPGERLLFTAEIPMKLGSHAHTTPPSVWKLVAEEIASGWKADTDVELAEREISELASASAGWWLVLRLWAAVPELRSGAVNPSDGRATAVLSQFFRDRVLTSLSTFEREGVEVPRPLEVFLTGEAFVAPRTSEDADLVLQLLGVPGVYRRAGAGERERVAWPFKRPLRLLAFLATRPGRQAPREEMIEALWPEASEDQIRRNLHPTVSRLRRTLRPCGGEVGRGVLLDGGVYRLDPDLVWGVDIEEFVGLCEDGDLLLRRGDGERAARRWQAAWRLYQGPLMQGHEEPWIRTLRTELHRRYLRMLRNLGELYLELEDFDAAEDALRGFLLEDPLEEGVYVSMMRAYAGRGRRDLVNRQYERLRSVLSNELGVEPSEETLAIYNELMA